MIIATIPLKKHRNDDCLITMQGVFTNDAIWRAWQHPRNKLGRFAKKGFEDITDEWLKNIKKGKYIKAQVIEIDGEPIFINGTDYKATGIRIKFEHTLRERYIGWKLNKDYGMEIIENPEVKQPIRHPMADFTTNENEPLELKSPRDALRMKWGDKNPFKELIKHKLRQSDTFVFDITTDRTTKELSVYWVNDIFNDDDYESVKRCLIMTNGRIYKMLARK